MDKSLAALHLDCTLNNSILPAGGGVRLIYLLLEVRLDDHPAPLEPAPVNLSLVVDVSESMYFRLVTESQMAELAQLGFLEEVMADGVPAWQVKDIPSEVMARFPRKIDRLKEALQAVVEQLRPRDSFSLIAFAGQAVTLIPTTAGHEKQRLLQEIEKLIELRLGDDTYMGRGMTASMDEINHGGKADDVSRMLLLTDGFTRDEKECYGHVKAAQASDISISTMGLGGEFNEELLIPLADQSGGNAYFIGDPSKMGHAFAQELNAVQAITYRNLELKLRLMQGAELRRAFRIKPVISDLGHLPKRDNSYNLDLGDLDQNVPPAFLLEIITPPRQAGPYRLAQLVLAYEPVGAVRSSSEIGEKVRQDVVVQYMPGPISTVSEPRVMNLVETVSAFKLQTRALQEAESGDFANATRKLEAAATRLLDMGEEALAVAMQTQAQQLAQGQLDGHATKKLRYETRKLTQKLTNSSQP